MSKSAHQLEIRANDKTASGFASISARAKATGAQLKSVLGGALAAAGAYMGFRQIASSIAELGKLSDIAQKTSTNVGELTQTVTGLGILGISNMGVEQLAKAFDYMQKTTGRSGLEGFKQTIAEIGKIPDVAKRSQEAMKVFGRSGMEFMPLINAADQGVEALNGVIAAMPAVPQSAANAGDKVKDAADIASNGVKSIWLQAIGAVCNWFDEHFTGGIRGAAAEAANFLEYYAKLAVISVQKAWRQITSYAEAIGGSWGAAVGTLMGGGSFGEAVDAMGATFSQMMTAREDELAELDQKNQARVDAWEKKRLERSAAIAKLAENYDKAAKSTSDRQVGQMKLDVASRETAIRNALVGAGTNEAMKLSLLGPSVKDEQKKTNELLQKVVENTEKTADNTEAADEEKAGDFNG